MPVGSEIVRESNGGLHSAKITGRAKGVNVRFADVINVGTAGIEIPDLAAKAEHLENTVQESVGRALDVLHKAGANGADRADSTGGFDARMFAAGEGRIVLAVTVPLQGFKGSDKFPDGTYVGDVLDASLRSDGWDV